MPCLNRDEKQTSLVPEMVSFGRRGHKGSCTAGGISPCPPPPCGPCAHPLPLQMMVFSTNGREAGLSLSLPPPHPSHHCNWLSKIFRWKGECSGPDEMIQQRFHFILNLTLNFNSLKDKKPRVIRCNEIKQSFSDSKFDHKWAPRLLL